MVDHLSFELKQNWLVFFSLHFHSRKRKGEACYISTLFIPGILKILSFGNLSVFFIFGTEILILYTFETFDMLPVPLLILNLEPAYYASSVNLCRPDTNPMQSILLLYNLDQLACCMYEIMNGIFLFTLGVTYISLMLILALKVQARQLIVILQ